MIRVLRLNCLNSENRGIKTSQELSAHPPLYACVHLYVFQHMYACVCWKAIFRVLCAHIQFPLYSAGLHFCHPGGQEASNASMNSLAAGREILMVPSQGEETKSGKLSTVRKAPIQFNLMISLVYRLPVGSFLAVTVVLLSSTTTA